MNDEKRKPPLLTLRRSSRLATTQPIASFLLPLSESNEKKKKLVTAAKTTAAAAVAATTSSKATMKTKMKSATIPVTSVVDVPLPVANKRVATTQRPKSRLIVSLLRVETKLTAQDIKSIKGGRLVVHDAMYGKGLFAGHVIKKGDVVVGTTEYTQVIPAKRNKVQWMKQYAGLETKAEALGLHYDQILSMDNEFFMFEHTKDALWIYMNHSRTYPNVCPAFRYVRGNSESRTKRVLKGVDFVAMRNIRLGEELLYDYGDIPKSWIDVRPQPLAYYMERGSSSSSLSPSSVP